MLCVIIFSLYCFLLFAIHNFEKSFLKMEYFNLQKSIIEHTQEKKTKNHQSMLGILQIDYWVYK